MSKRVAVKPACALSPGSEQVQQALAAIDERWIVQTLKELTGAKYATIGGERFLIRSRCSINKGLNDAMKYLQEFYSELGVSWRTVAYRGFNHDLENLEVTFPGSSNADEVIVVGSHLDSTAGGWDDEKVAPGADDDASGTVACMQLALALADLQARGAQFARTIRILHFTGEEQGCYGSLAYASQCKRSGDEIVAMIQLDMIGYCRSEQFRVDLNPASDAQSCAKLVDLVARSCEGLNLQPFAHRKKIGKSDHVSFWDYWVPSMCISEELDADNNCVLNPHNHKKTDRVETLNIEYLIEVTKLAIVATCALLHGDRIG